MTLYHIIQTASGADLGYYEGRTPEEAIRAMLADAGAPDAEPDAGLVAEIEEEYEDMDAEEEELLIRRSRAYNS